MSSPATSVIESVHDAKKDVLGGMSERNGLLVASSVLCFRNIVAQPRHSLLYRLLQHSLGVLGASKTRKEVVD